jgi:hypothetical protein
VFDHDPEESLVAAVGAFGACVVNKELWRESFTKEFGEKVPMWS